MINKKLIKLEVMNFNLKHITSFFKNRKLDNMESVKPQLCKIDEFDLIDA